MRNRRLDFPLMVFIAVLSAIGLSQPNWAKENGRPATAVGVGNSTQVGSEKKADPSGASEQQSSNGGPASGSGDETEEAGTASIPQQESTQSAAKVAKATSTDTAEKQETSWYRRVFYPLMVLGIGIASVLGLIIGLKINAFLALITSAILVSILAPGPISEKIGRVASSLGDSVGGIGIVIALAAIIGKCMLDSGAADRIVRTFMNILGEKRAPVALLGSGFVLAVPVFFDTVFYLLVPLARSLHRRTGVKYLLYIMAIGAGGAITHTLVPPTPGPLLMASNLGVDVGTMIMIGALVALPAAIAGLICGAIADKIMQTPMRELPGSPEPEPIADEDLPTLWLSLAPVIIPVVLISLSTIVTAVADNQGAARFKKNDITPEFIAAVRNEGQDPSSVARRILDYPALSDSSLAAGEGDPEKIREGLNQLILDKKFYDEDAFLGTKLNFAAKGLLKKNLVRMKRADVERMNRALLESAFPDMIPAHQWNTSSRQMADLFGFFGNANFALLVSTIIALWTLAIQRNLSFADLARSTEEALMSGGIIILITAGGGAFGAMLSKAEVGDAIKELFAGSGSDGALSGMGFLLLGFTIAAILKIAQGSSTVAMIVGSSMVAAIVNGDSIGFNYVYLATAIGAGSLFGSWMNDSGFWIFAKMGGLTEGEALKSWTVMLVVLSLVSLLVTIMLTFILPLI
ncbi:GntP family permease [Mariniblastus sp.]|jgi:gluconate:H+ symporter, GntP family|nr:SLC13 family permease [Mariniblastus sp.]MDB4756200.1 GntP family permease [Mariniblastus sp.]